MSLRQQLGMLNMLSDMLESLGSAIQPAGNKILDAVLICSVTASRKLDAADGSEEKVSLLRSIRQVGLQCIVKIFASLDDSADPIHAQVVLDELFVPRQTKFASENTQSVSAMLRLFSVFAASRQPGPYLSQHSEIMLDRTAELLREPSAKHEVRLFILQEILDNLFANAAVSILTQEHVTSFVRSIGELLKQQPSKELVDACVGSLSNLASWIEDDQDALQVIEVSADLLKKPQKLVSQATKAGLLKVLLPILDLISTSAAPVLYDSMCGLFSRIYDPETRPLLALAFAKVCQFDNDLLKSAQICEDLNSQGDRLDEPDHERRERGFGEISTQAEIFSLHQWQPILQNCLFYLRDETDIVNRTSASQGLERLIDAASRNNELRPLIVNVLLPGIEHGMKHESELVRAEFLRLLGHLAESIPDLPATSDMRSLTISGDDEASVFNNILHIQQHRRLRALRRLVDEAGSLTSVNTTKIFIPLLEHFVFDRAEGDVGRTLADQTVLTIGALGKSLTWTSFRAIFKRYVGYLSSKADQEALTMRLLSALVDSIAPTSISDEVVVADTSSRKEDDIKRDLLPPLLDYIHLKDESTVDRRMPVAVTIVKLLLLLPKEDLSSKLAPVLTDVCQILRSHSQEARDQTRKTLAAILALVGPTYLGFILKELRGALKRGSQLHVLSFTVHSLLVGAVESYKPGDLDYCLLDLAAVIMDDIFGVTGQEKDSEDYRSRLKEVKSSKSFDTMELLARLTPMQRLAQLVQPLRALLSESIDSKTLQKADDLLARLRNGVQQNPAAQSRDALIFCYEIIRQVHHDQHHQLESKMANVVKHDRYIIQPEASQKAKRKGTVLIHSFKLAGFALNLLRRVLRRYDDLMSAANMKGFLPIIGDALVQGQEEIQTSAIKMLNTIMKVDLPELEQNAPVYLKEAVRIIKSSSSLAGDAPKAALDLLTAILREKRNIVINPKDIAEVLKILKADIDEPDRQGAIYKFLRATLNRKLLITEVYEVMDGVGRVSVTNADRNLRESARSAFVQFIVEYPHAKDRWNKQATFLVENLKYEHASGRQSVMELLNQLLPKLPDEIVEQLSLTLFVALVPVQSSDSESSCRQMAGILIGKLFERVDSKQMDTFLSLLEKWASKKDNSTIRTAAFQCWRIALQKNARSDNVLATVQNNVSDLLSDSRVETFDGNDHLTLSALDALDALVDISPESAFAERARTMWESLYATLNSGSADTGEAVAKLVEESFSHLASSSSRSGLGLSTVPLRGSYGMALDSHEMRQICQSSFEVLLSEGQELTEGLASQTVRNLVFLGRCFAANGMQWTADDQLDEDITEHGARTSAIAHLFSQLSYITRQENLPALPRVSAIQCQIALIRHVENIPNVVALVKPLYVLTDPSVPKPNDEAHKALVDLARELLDAVQQKSGTESYVSALGEARSYAKSRRDERRQKRKISAVSAPEKWAQAKKRKHEVQRTKSKANALVARGKRRGW
jgi:U3 small nucleolar RNA-associated protein 20